METTSAYEIGNWAAASLESGVTVCVTSEYLLIGSVTVAYEGSTATIAPGCDCVT
jgi:hypothetical protein